MPSRRPAPRPACARWAAIQRAPHSSWPSRKSAARTASTQTGARASMIALVSPWLAAMPRNPAPSACRPGRPNDVFEAPQVMFTPRSSRIRRTVSMNSVTARGSAPTGIASGSMTMSSGGMPWSPADRHDLARQLEPALRLHRDLVVVGEPDHGRAVPCDERQDRLEPLVLAGDRVHERLALVGAEAGLERLDDGRVDHERQVGQALHERDRASHAARSRRPAGRPRSRRARRRRPRPARPRRSRAADRSPACELGLEAPCGRSG